MLGVPTLSSPEADVTSTPAQLQNTSQGAVLFDNASGSAPTTDAGSSLWGGQSSVGGFLSSLFASGAAATPKAQTVAAQAPGLAAALPFLAGMSTNGLLIGGFGLLAVVLLVKR